MNKEKTGVEGERKEVKKAKVAEESDKVAPWALDFIAFIFILRGLVNLYVTFDELYFIGSNTQTLLFVFSLIAGVGILVRRRHRWGLYIGLIVSFFFLLFQGDSNAMERVFGRLISLTIFLGLLKTRNDFAKETKLDRIVGIAVLLIISGTLIYEAAQPNEMELANHYIKLAIEKEDYRLCDNLKSPLHKGECYRSVSIALKDPMICKLIEYEVEKERCYKTNKRFFGKDKEYCKAIFDDEVKQKVCETLQEEE